MLREPVSGRRFVPKVPSSSSGSAMEEESRDVVEHQGRRREGGEVHGRGAGGGGKVGGAAAQGPFTAFLRVLRRKDEAPLEQLVIEHPTASFDVEDALAGLGVAERRPGQMPLTRKRKLFVRQFLEEEAADEALAEAEAAAARGMGGGGHGEEGTGGGGGGGGGVMELIWKDGQLCLHHAPPQKRRKRTRNDGGGSAVPWQDQEGAAPVMPEVLLGPDWAADTFVLHHQHLPPLHGSSGATDAGGFDEIGSGRAAAMGGREGSAGVSNGGGWGREAERSLWEMDDSDASEGAANTLEAARAERRALERPVCFVDYWFSDDEFDFDDDSPHNLDSEDSNDELHWTTDYPDSDPDKEYAVRYGLKPDSFLDGGGSSDEECEADAKHLGFREDDYEGAFFCGEEEFGGDSDEENLAIISYYDDDYERDAYGQFVELSPPSSDYDDSDDDE